MNEINEETMRQLDWTLPTRKLYAQTGLPKRTLSFWRKKLGVGRATQYAPQDAPSMRKMRIIPDDIDWSKPKRAIAAECGVSLQRINQIHKRKFGLVRKANAKSEAQPPAKNL